jgi:hypothetical protein
MKKAVMLLLVLAVGLPAAGWTQKKKINLGDLIRETQQQNLSPEKMSVVWWIPLQFWQINLEERGALSAEAVDKLLAVLRPYLFLVVAEASVGPVGGFTYKSEEALRAGLKIFDARGRSYEPLANDKVSEDVKNFVQMMRPILSGSMGPFGENLRFFLFPARDSSGVEIADAASDNDFDVQVGERRFHWRLPLGSHLPAKVCPDDGELLNGAWAYCPWHGTKLKPQEAPAAPVKSNPG